MKRTAAIVTVGSELVEGLRVDTNTAEIAAALAPRGFRVTEAVSVGDDIEALAGVLARLAAAYELVIATGGLGPTHDDITRQAASVALGLPLERDERLVRALEPVLSRHRDSQAADNVLLQALVLQGAEVIDATTGTAPGQVIEVAASVVALLPGPPAEMRPMLHTLLDRHPLVRAEPRELGVTGTTESDAQVAAQRGLGDFPDVGLTVLARPGDVRVLLLDEGAGAEGLAEAADAVAAALGAHCYSTDGSSLQEVVLRHALTAGVTLAVAESCTGGMVAASLTEMPGASAAFLGGVVAYDNRAKVALLGVAENTLAVQGAVSPQAAEEMAEGARTRFGADIAVSITGVAGPGGGSADKPVGTVWFGVATSRGVQTHLRHFPGTSRSAVRLRATAVALDQMRLALREISP